MAQIVWTTGVYKQQTLPAKYTSTIKTYLQNIRSYRHQARHYPVTFTPSRFNCYDVQSKTAANIRQEISTTATPAIVSNILNISANILNSRFIQVANIARGVHINHQYLQNTGSRHQARRYPASSPPSHFNGLWHANQDSCRHQAGDTHYSKLLQLYEIQSTPVVSNSKGLTETLRDIRTSTYQSWESE